MGQGARLTQVGFTYSPWDRNYGRSCIICAAENAGSKMVHLTTIDNIPYEAERGDPQRHNVRTLMGEVPVEHQSTHYQVISWQFPRGEGRRLFFLYALGRR